jgi:arginine metabolism regulation protein II
VFLLDAERLIRIRGLAKQKSFKIRILHHMYTHLRIVAESTAIAGDNSEDSAQSPPVSSVQTTSVLRKFRITEDSLNIGLDPAQEKSLEVGYNDIHLEIQGRWHETLFPEIYGVPESLITLLSQVTCLANEKSRLEAIARTNASVSSSLENHIKTLEKSVWSWKLPASKMGPPRPQMLVGSDLGNQDLVDQPNARLMVLAMHQALIIYFYRRIYNMSAMILQDLAQKTLDYLQPCIDEHVKDRDFAISIAWPAFIAACEAVSPELQEQALASLAAIENKGPLFASEPATQIVSTIWEKRMSSGDMTISWPQVMC